MNKLNYLNTFVIQQAQKFLDNQGPTVLRMTKVFNIQIT